MSSLSAKEEAFIAQMLQSSDLEAYGFQALIRKGKARHLFEPLRAAGFFTPERNPSLVRDGNGVRVPSWPALAFLLATAKEAQHADDSRLPQAIMNVVRDVSRWRDAAGTIRSNFHTWRVFAELLGLVPLSAIADEDLDLIPFWLDDPFNSGLVIQALDDGLLARLLKSDRPEDATRAAAVFDHCTEIRFVETASRGRKEVKTVGSAYWVSQMVDRHAHTLGRRAGGTAATRASERLRETFTATSTHELSSSAYRAAIEEHGQNGDWHEAENAAVRALRDVLLGWCEGASTESTEFVVRLLREGVEIQRRVALYVIDMAWNQFRLSDVLASDIFRPGHLHELYGLLTSRFSSLTPEQKSEVVRNIAHAAPDILSDRARAQFQASILHAIADRGFAPADELLADIEARFPGVRGSETRWDFHTYTETRAGPGPSPFSPQELVAFAEEGKLRERVESFKETDRWSGPTLGGLVDALKAASQAAPQAFVNVLRDLNGASYVLLYPVLFGLKTAWGEEQADRKADWEDRWPAIFECFEGLVTRLQHAEPDGVSAGSFLPTRDWVISMVAEFLLATTRDDSRLYPDTLVQRGWQVIQGLLRASGRAPKMGEDPVQEAINHPAGHVIEAMFSHALRLMRKADREGRGHDAEWQAMRGVFEAEIHVCKNANFEMSTLCGMHLAQLLYIDATWVDEWMPVLFPVATRDNFSSAVAGVAYTANSWQVYELLVKHGVVEEALRRRDLPGRSTRESILGRMAAAFAHGKEDLESTRFALLFAEGQADDIQTVARTLAVFASGDDRGRYRDRIITFWHRSVEWSRERPNASDDVLATLAHFSTVLDRIDETTKPLVLAAAQHIDVGIDVYGLVDSLVRFADTDPDGVIEVLRAAVTARRPTFDYEGKLRGLLTQLVAKGKGAEVFSLLDAVGQVPGMTEFYKQLADGDKPIAP
jgi:hypothetical protein